VQRKKEAKERMTLRHTLYYQNEMAAENALVIVRCHIDIYAGLLTPIGTTYAYSVVFETDEVLPDYMEEMLMARALPDAVALNHEVHKNEEVNL
jgi:hypothetical protein